MRFFGRACLSIAGIGTVLVAAAGACIPDPKGEYEDYRERTANLGPTDTPPSDAAALDTKPPETATEALYVGICTTALAGKDPAQALRFYTKSKYTPEGTGGAGKLTLTVKPLVGWQNGDYITPKSVSESETRGTAIPANDLTVAPGGRFTANLGTMNLPSDANSISGREAVINDTVIDGKFGTGEFCATLGGHLVVPYEYDFVPKDNVCLFIEVKEGDPVPVRTADQFVCAL
jgi:hypothetical protein